MSSTVWETAVAVLVALGGGGLLVLLLSSFLGKVWAQRIMDRDRQAFAERLEELRSQLVRQNTEAVESLKVELDFHKQMRYHEYSDKLLLYRAVADVVADIIVDMGRAAETGTYDAAAIEQFERKRLRLYGYLGIAAPQDVMTALDHVMDGLLDMLEGKTPFDFAKIRSTSYDMLNEIRKDVALDKRPIIYTGHR